MSREAAPASAASASAPGRLELPGPPGGPRLSVALDRRAVCRVEPCADGVVIESKESLSELRARDVDELRARSPGSLAGQVLAALGASGGLRLVTEWKLPAGAGIDGDAALALATTAAAARALGRAAKPEELLTLARAAAARSGRSVDHGLHAALFGGVVRSRGAAGDGLPEAERIGVDPGRIGESLMVIDAGDEPGRPDPEATGAGTGEPALDGHIVDALVGGRYEEVVGLVGDGAGGAPGGPGQRRIAGVVREAGGGAWVLGARLVAVWAPPGARGPGRREAVEAALKAAGLRPLAVRVDLRGLEVD